MEDRRSTNRVPFRKRVQFGSDKKMNSGYTFNLATGGVGIKSHRVFAPGSKIMIYLNIKDEPIRVKSIVKWTSPNLPGMISNMGLKFLNRIN